MAKKRTRDLKNTITKQYIKDQWKDLKDKADNLRCELGFLSEDADQYLNTLEDNRAYTSMCKFSDAIESLHDALDAALREVRDVR